MICQWKCPVGAIEGAKREVYVIDGVCLSVCLERFSAVECVPERLNNGGEK